MTKTRWFQLLCARWLPAVLGFVKLFVHSPWSRRVYFFFPLTREHFKSAGVPLATEVALLLTSALWHGYSKVLDHNSNTITNSNGSQTIQLLEKTRELHGKEKVWKKLHSKARISMDRKSPLCIDWTLNGPFLLTS